MRDGRWYPTGVQHGGRPHRGHRPGSTRAALVPQRNADVEVFTPSPDINGRGTFSLLGTLGGAGTAGRRPLSAHVRDAIGPHDGGGALPRGQLVSSTRRGLNSFTWQDFPSIAPDRVWGTGVLMPGGTGGSTQGDAAGRPAPSTDFDTNIAVRTTEVFDEANPSAGWRAAPSMQIGRGHHNTVLLPDGSMVTVGGGVGTETETNGRPIPSSARSTSGTPPPAPGRSAQPRPKSRAYHSTALLLPDGRVISAGDDVNGGTDSDTAEIYEPPYLFKGPRPTITAAPANVTVRTTLQRRDP